MTSNVKFLLIIPLLVVLIEIIDARASNGQGFATDDLPGRKKRSAHHREHHEYGMNRGGPNHHRRGHYRENLPTGHERQTHVGHYGVYHNLDNLQRMLHKMPHGMPPAMRHAMQELPHRHHEQGLDDFTEFGHLAKQWKEAMKEVNIKRSELGLHHLQWNVELAKKIPNSAFDEDRHSFPPTVIKRPSDYAVMNLIKGVGQLMHTMIHGGHVHCAQNGMCKPNSDSIEQEWPWGFLDAHAKHIGCRGRLHTIKVHVYHLEVVCKTICNLDDEWDQLEEDEIMNLSSEEVGPHHGGHNAHNGHNQMPMPHGNHAHEHGHQNQAGHLAHNNHHMGHGLPSPHELHNNHQKAMERNLSPSINTDMNTENSQLTINQPEILITTDMEDIKMNGM
ncbi:hypothetical protein Ddc_12862 [Ditylenchus destructor]|nr:hypothetical protein Ddc_12862 [Ditylenchus destructor]